MTLFFLSRFLLLDLLELLSSDELYLLDAESDDDGSDYGSAGTRAFSFCFKEYVSSFGESVDRVSSVGSGVFLQ